jgi:hypothetical protein
VQGKARSALQVSAACASPAAASPRFDPSLAVLSTATKKNLMLEFSDAGSASALRDSAMRFKVVAYYPLQFAELRRRVVVGGELAFILSLSRCKRWHPRGGKSTAYFAKTHDERFVIKQLSRPEKVRVWAHVKPVSMHSMGSCNVGDYFC